MADKPSRSRWAMVHPLHAILLVSSLPLLLGALLSDWAYAVTFQIQWINFAAWLVAGALIFIGLALLWTLIDALRARLPGQRGKWTYPGLLAATFVLGLVNALVHAKDGWATMPEGLILSLISLLLALGATWAAFSSPKIGQAR